MDAATEAPGRLQPVVERVLSEPRLWPELIALDSDDELVEALLSLAERWGLPLEADDVRRGLQDRRRQWLERWI